MSEPTITERLAAARRRAWDARVAARTAEQEERDLELEEAAQHARAKLDDALTGSELSPKLHGELVASAAREHGAACARAGTIQDVTWRHLRVALSSLVERLERRIRERDEARRERDEARAALAALVDALHLDDRPRIEAIQSARETLARWGSR